MFRRRHQAQLVIEEHKVNPQNQLLNKVSTAEDKSNYLNQLPNEVFISITEFLSFSDLCSLSSTSSQILISSASSVRQSAIGYCLEKIGDINFSFATEVNQKADSLINFRDTILSQYHVNIFHHHYLYLLELANDRHSAFQNNSPIASFRNYVLQMEKELDQYQYSLRSFVCGEVGFEPMSALEEVSCCQRALFNNCCNPSSPIQPIGMACCGLERLLSTCLPAFVTASCQGPAGTIYSIIGCTAKITHEMRLHRTRQLFNNHEIVKQVKQFNFFVQKKEELSHAAGTVSRVIAFRKKTN